MQEAVYDDVVGWAAAKATLDLLDYAALLCNEEGEVLVGNEAALALLDQKDGLALREGRIHVIGAAQRERLQAVLAGRRNDRDVSNGRDHDNHALLAPRPSGLPAYQIVLRRIGAPCSAFSHRHDRLWSMMISDPARTSTLRVRALSALYKLTPAETRIASRLISGETPDEIAAHSGVKITTIRSQLASLYAKTGTHRQSHLVCLFTSVPPVR